MSTQHACKTSTFFVFGFMSNTAVISSNWMSDAAILWAYLRSSLSKELYFNILFCLFY